MRSQILNWSHHDYFMIHLYFKNWNLFLNNTYIFFLKSTPCPKLAFCSTHHPCQFEMLHGHIIKISPWGMAQGAWPRRQNKNPIWHVLYLICKMTHKVWYKIFEIDLVIEIYDIWPSEKEIALAYPIHVSNSHTKNWQMGGQMYRLTDGGNNNIPFAFLKSMGI